MTFNDKLLRDPYARPSVDERPGFMMQQTLPIESSTIKQQVDGAISSMLEEDTDYLLNHPEITAIVDLLMGELFAHRPRAPLKFAGELFKRPNLRAMIAARTKLGSVWKESPPTRNWNLEHQGPTDWRNTIQMKLCEERERRAEEEEEEDEEEEEEEKVDEEEEGEKEGEKFREGEEESQEEEFEFDKLHDRFRQQGPATYYSFLTIEDYMKTLQDDLVDEMDEEMEEEMDEERELTMSDSLIRAIDEIRLREDAAAGATEGVESPEVELNSTLLQ